LGILLFSLMNFFVTFFLKKGACGSFFTLTMVSILCMVVWWILLFSMTNYVSWLYYLLVVAILSYGSFFMMYLYLVLVITERI
jgi:hypothetical protein